tara:strand:- start:3633 stop:4817 length:1185 start_codon:yes stop_codon:yes gene_type:complete
MMNTSPTESCRECNSLNWKLDSVKGEWVCPDCGETKQNLTSDEDSNQGSLHGENSQYQEVRRGDSAGGTLNLRSKKYTKDAYGTSANAKFVRRIKRGDRIAFRTDPARKKARKDEETKKLIENLLRDIRPDSNENRNLLQAILKDRRIFVDWKKMQRRLTGSGVRIKNDDAHIIAWTEIYVYISNPNSNVVIAIKRIPPDGIHCRFKDKAGLLTISQITKNRNSNHERRCGPLKGEINKQIKTILHFIQVALNPSNQLNLGLFKLRDYDRIEESNDFISSICNILKSDRDRLISDVEFKSKVTTLEDDKYEKVISTLRNPVNTEKFNLIIEVQRINKPMRIIDHLLYHIYGSKLIRRSDLEKVLDRKLQAKKHNEIINYFSTLEGFPSDQNKGQ